MKRQITFILIFMIMAFSWGFADAQSTKIPTLTEYFKQRDKGITLTNWVKEYKQGVTKITEYPKPQDLLLKGDIFATHYIIPQQIELDVMREEIDKYRQSIISYSKSISQSPGYEGVCDSLTNTELVTMMDASRLYENYLEHYGLIKGEGFDRDKYVEVYYKMLLSCFTVVRGMPSWPRRLVPDLIMLYNMSLSEATFFHSTQYNNLFTNGTGSDSIFDIMEDIKNIQELSVNKTPKLPQFDAQSLKGQPIVVADLPDELIVSTQQLVNQLQIETVIDPRKDTQISSLIGQVTTVSGSSAIIPTGSILNACMDPAIVTNTTDSIIEQLKNTQQAVTQYSQSLNTDQSLNNAINGSLDPSSIIPQSPKLSALEAPSTTKIVTPVADFSANPLGDSLANIDESTVAGQGGGGGNKLGTDVSAPLGPKAGQDTLKQCVGGCWQKYNNYNGSACVRECEASGQGGGLLDARRCNQLCFNAKIACTAACLCDSTIPKQETGEVAKIHEMFEVRWCVVPTNKLRGLSDETCIRVDPVTGIKQPPSLECLLDKTIDYAEYNRESGKGGIRIKPREWYQLPNKFDLKGMIRFPVNVIGRKPRDDQQKKKDIESSRNKDNFDKTISQSPEITSLKTIGSSSDMVIDFNSTVLDLRGKMGDNAQSIENIVEG